MKQRRATSTEDQLAHWKRKRIERAIRRDYEKARAARQPKLTAGEAVALCRIEREKRAEREAYAEDELRQALSRIDARPSNQPFRQLDKQYRRLPRLHDVRTSPVDRLVTALEPWHGGKP